MIIPITDSEVNALIARYDKDGVTPSDKQLQMLQDRFIPHYQWTSTQRLVKATIKTDAGQEVSVWGYTIPEATIMCLMKMKAGYAYSSRQVPRQEGPRALSWGEQLYKNASVAGSDRKESWVSGEAVSAR